jgi:hypothetical protein|tara:strand:- start:1241 stop:1858 length:618 start_codon:yes stop_codon:yes gene_type:complete
MAGSYFKVKDFIAKVRSEDLSRSSRFEIEINGPSSLGADRHVSILCEEATVPGLLIPYTPIKIGNWVEPRAQGIEYFGDNATFTFYCDTNWDVRAFFEDWMGRITVDPLSKEVGFYDNYTGAISIHTLDRNDNRTNTWELVDVVPRSLGLTPLAQSNDSVNRVNVSVSYKYWKSDGLPVGSKYKGLKRFMNFKDLDLKQILRRSI